MRVKLTPVSGFSLNAIAPWARNCLAPGSTVCSDGLACIAAVTQAGCIHHCTVIGGRKPMELPEFHWINTVLGNLKTSLSGSYHAFAFGEYNHALSGSLRLALQPTIQPQTLPGHLLVAAVHCMPHSQRVIRMA